MTEDLNDKPTLSDLKFNGKKAAFTSWKARFVAHLNGLKPSMGSNFDQSYIDVDELAKALKLDAASDAEAIEAEKSKKFYYLSMQESAIRGLLSKVLPNELLVQLQAPSTIPTSKIHDV
ncbi:hypothetical protein AeMF1_007445 [Aphanomyces euteiches]|nr:hypothetical protein AeMF1_007445 [Aphanomyces euteiches]KAH9164969.1 hypothetical protein AeNC1_018600 [Aphanomyces euteiches]